ncbi:MAG TPA: RlmE family RNA methyltransferase [Burkholderiaceae bacterium]|nr:RlmE family RNA methyltransferase [Burkholderiaceae bacterium]
MAKNRFSKAWMHEHLTDPYVKLAQQRQYRSRAAFKLIEIDDQERLIRPGIVAVDLGAAPGSWSQVLRERMRSDGQVSGRIVAVDLLPMEPVPDVTFIQGDFRDPAVLQQLDQALGGAQIDLVVSDLAPNLSGVGVADAARMGHLAELAIEFAVERLKPNGALLIKCFHGSGYSQIVEAFKHSFVRVVTRKPRASRDRSAETYLLGKGLKSRLRP